MNVRKKIEYYDDNSRSIYETFFKDEPLFISIQMIERAIPARKFSHSFFPLSSMSFLSKQPSVLPRVLCASDCPPHDVLHECSEYPLYYDALYFPEYHSSLFRTEKKVCQWLLNGLLQHFVDCPFSPSNLPNNSHLSMNKIIYHAPNFFLQLFGVEIVFSKFDVESSSFNFCTLHRQLLAVRSNTLSVSPDDCLCVADAERVLFEVPPWFFFKQFIYFRSLSRYSVSDLKPVAYSLPHTVLRHKKKFIECIVQDLKKRAATMTTRKPSVKRTTRHSTTASNIQSTSELKADMMAIDTL